MLDGVGAVRTGRGEMLVNIQDMLRAGSVKRWHIVETARAQTLADHMFNVSVIATNLGMLLGYDQDMLRRISVAAMLHDIDEVIEGDIPTPTKEKNGINSDTPLLVRSLPLKAQKLVKLADLIESYWFIKEFGVGRHAKQVVTNCYDRLYAYMGKGYNPDTIRMIEREIINPLTIGEFTI